MINAVKLQEIANASPTSEEMFLDWALRQRHRDKLDIPRFRRYLVKKGAPFNEDHFFATLKRLESENVGRIVYGPSHRPLQWIWKQHVKSVGLAGVGERPNGGRSSPRGRVLRTAARLNGGRPNQILRRLDSSREVVSNVRNQTVAIALGDGRLLRLELPENLSKDDCETIAKVVMSLH